MKFSWKSLIGLILELVVLALWGAYCLIPHYQKKNKNITIQKKEELDTSIKGTTFIKIAGFILLLLLVLWYVLAVFVTKEVKISGKNDNKADTANTETISNRILANKTFEQKEEKYYVYYYDFQNEDKGISSAISRKNELKIYRVDTSSSLNKNYVTEDIGNNAVTGIDNLKVKSPTLLEITNDQVTGYYEGNNNIIKFLNN